MNKMISRSHNFILPVNWESLWYEIEMYILLIFSPRIDITNTWVLIPVNPVFSLGINNSRVSEHCFGKPSDINNMYMTVILY